MMSWLGPVGGNVGNLIMGGNEPGPLPWRLESLHASLSLSGRLMGILRPVVEAFVLLQPRSSGSGIRADGPRQHGGGLAGTSPPGVEFPQVRLGET
jgi:hypothetical protein